MKDKSYLLDHWKIVEKRKTVFLGLIFFIVVITFAGSFIIPKTYESEAVIRLGQFESNKFIVEPILAVQLLTSSTILIPAMDGFYKDKAIDWREFRAKNLEVGIKFEDGAREASAQMPLVKVKVKTEDRNKSQNIALAISTRFVEYGNELLEKKIEPIKEEYTGTVKNVKEKGSNEVSLFLQDKDRINGRLKKEIEASQKNIQEIKNILTVLGSQPDLYETSASLAMAEYKKLLISLEEKGLDLRTRLSKEEESLKLELEQRDINLRGRLLTEELKFRQKNANISRFEIISKPSMPAEKSHFYGWRYMVTAFILGIMICFIWILVEAS